MSIGNKFLQRINEATKAEDTDSIKDGFSIPLDTQQKSLASRLKRPLEKKLVALHAMVGVPGRYLNSEDAEETIAGAADVLRGQVSIRRQFDKFYSGLATAKGYSIAAPVTEGKKPKDEDDNEPIEAHGVKGVKSTVWRKKFKNRAALNKWVEDNDGDIEVYATRKLDESTEDEEVFEAKAQKRGGFLQKLMETVLVRLGLPESLIETSGPGAVGAALLKTAKLIEQDSNLEQTLRQLAVKMGIKANDAIAEGKEETVGWYVAKNDKNIAGPMSETEAKTEAKRRGGDEKGYTAEYVSDYSSKRGAMKEAIDVGTDEFAEAVVGLISDLGIPDAVLQVRRANVIKALREKKTKQTNRAEVLRKIQILRDALSKGQRDNNQE